MIIICERQLILLEAVLKDVTITITELMLVTEKAIENIFCIQVMTSNNILCIQVMTSNNNEETYNNCFAFGDI
jgi:hypothetical protein